MLRALIVLVVLSGCAAPPSNTVPMTADDAARYRQMLDIDHAARQPVGRQWWQPVTFYSMNSGDFIVVVPVE